MMKEKTAIIVSIILGISTVFSQGVFSAEHGGSIVVLSSDAPSQRVQSKYEAQQVYKYVGDVATGNCVPINEFKGSIMAIMYNSLEECQNAARIKSLGCGFNTKSFACCEFNAISNSCSSERFATGCAFSVDDANVRCAFTSGTRDNYCVKWKKSTCP